ncbi:hypothetical protein K443DRAFT_630636 [Laccaria amethystina LaAM-08-1]|uniref:Uncharacterized protein n=1 Tax=Laccaria amethystina LaAM-08-1 TaxID=1095629 RepID=A0A0C9XJG7_9AGAR|nr:hypothetical protein K443DRAFT_630636 [Laccaria amethystina LaAM-08-1]
MHIIDDVENKCSHVTRAMAPFRGCISLPLERHVGKPFIPTCWSNIIMKDFPYDVWQVPLTFQRGDYVLYMVSTGRCSWPR